MAFDLTVVTPEGESFRDAVDAVVLPGSEGDFGVLSGHERFLSALRAGEMEIRSERRGSVFAAIADGFAEVNGKAVVVLVDECARGDEIDPAEAGRGVGDAEQELGRARVSGRSADEIEALEAALAWARLRLSAARRSGR